MNMHHDQGITGVRLHENHRETADLPGSSIDSTTVKKGNNSFFVELIKFTLIAIAIVLPFRMFVAQPFVVSGSSMVPSFENGEYLLVDELTYRFTEPERGEVIIFRYPENPSKFFIKRVIGMPGETINIDDGHISIVNTENPNGFMLDEPYLENVSRETVTVTLENDEYFVLGDNRVASSDSRTWGALPKNLIVGKALLRLLPVNKINIFPGEQTFELTK